MYNLVESKNKFNFRPKDSHNGRLSSAQNRNYNNRVYQSVLDLVGNTPLVKLNKIPKDHGLSCEIYAKCEFWNPSGSIKDRIALAMVQDAKKDGVVNELTTFVEPTSGNTGIGIAFNAALMGNKCTLVTQDKNSSEKVNTTILLGAEVIQIKTNVEEISIARQLRDENPNTIMLDQFDNDVNPKTHYENTAAEIISALDGVDLVAMGAGTGGTMTGVAYRIKEAYPECKVVTAEPDGSSMMNPHAKSHEFLVEGIGGSWVPMVLDTSVVDDIEVVTDEESFLMARELARKEGLLCGGSSGTAMTAAIKAAKKLNLGAGKRVVVILPDGIRNYMSKFVSNQWMEAQLFMDPPQHTMKWWTQPITRLNMAHKYPLINEKFTCAQAMGSMNTNNVNIAVVVNDKGWFVGAASKDSFRYFATNPTKLPRQKSEDFNFDDPVTVHLVKHCKTLAENGKKGMPTIGLLSRILDITPFVVIGKDGHDAENDKDYFLPEGVVTADDVINYIFTESR